MNAGFDRYYQREVFPWWGFTGDRQPEFTQVDSGKLLSSEWSRNPGYHRRLDFSRVIWRNRQIGSKYPIPTDELWCEAMALYGSDKPDTRLTCYVQDFDYELVMCRLQSSQKLQQLRRLLSQKWSLLVKTSINWYRSCEAIRCKGLAFGEICWRCFERSLLGEVLDYLIAILDCAVIVLEDKDLVLLVRYSWSSQCNAWCFACVVLRKSLTWLTTINTSFR